MLTLNISKKLIFQILPVTRNTELWVWPTHDPASVPLCELLESHLLQKLRLRRRWCLWTRRRPVWMDTGLCQGVIHKLRFQNLSPSSQKLSFLRLRLHCHKSTRSLASYSGGLEFQTAFGIQMVQSCLEFKWFRIWMVLNKMAAILFGFWMVRTLLA